jgi:hypothetical protein
MHTASCFHIRGRTLLSVNQINGIIFLNKAILKLSRYLECHLNFVNALLNTTTAIFHKKQREKERVCVCVCRNMNSAQKHKLARFISEGTESSSEMSERAQ